MDPVSGQDSSGRLEILKADRGPAPLPGLWKLKMVHASQSPLLVPNTDGNGGSKHCRDDLWLGGHEDESRL